MNLFRKTAGCQVNYHRKVPLTTHTLLYNPQRLTLLYAETHLSVVLSPPPTHLILIVIANK